MSYDPVLEGNYVWSWLTFDDFMHKLNKMRRALSLLPVFGGLLRGSFGDRPLVSHTLIFLRQIDRHSAWTSDARPSVAGTLTLKQCSRVHQDMLFIFIER